MEGLAESTKQELKNIIVEKRGPTVDRKSTAAAVPEELLPAELRQELRRAFDSVDEDADGVIESLQLLDVLTMLGYSPTEAEFYDMVAVMEYHGVISYEHFEENFAYFNKIVYTEQEMRTIFAVFDVYNSGFVEMDDLERVSKNLGFTFSANDLSEMMLQADRDGDRKLNFEEFKNVLCKDEDAWQRPGMK